MLFGVGKLSIMLRVAVCKGSAHRKINMSPCVPVPEEVDVFKVPHLRMKGLVNDYFEMVNVEHEFVLI